MNKYGSTGIGLLCLFSAACVNNIGEEYQPGNIPMTFSVSGKFSIRKAMQNWTLWLITRMTKEELKPEVRAYK